MQLAVDTAAHTNLHDGDTIVRHAKRPNWGLAVMLWERESKRGYRFEDGSTRTFMTKFCGFFSAADAPTEVAAMLLAARKEQPSDPALKVAKRKKFETPLLEDQLAVFSAAHDNGFSGKGWLKNHRGASGGRRLKRHRDAAIAEAKTLLAKDALDDLLASGRYEVVVDRACAVLSNTDLVTKKQLEPLHSARRSSALALALRNYLYEPDADGALFDEFLRRLGRSSSGRYSWPLMTALRALVLPETHICIKPSVFMRQAGLLSPSLAKKSRPTGSTYNRWLAMAQDLRTQLAEMEVEPADMLDVYDFVWQTMRPAAAAEVEAARVARATPKAPAADADPAASEVAEPAGEPDEAEAA